MKMSTPHDVPTHMLDNPDQYITKVGKFLRKSSLDELPQIGDIFIGNMSVIGPRPGLWNQYLLTAERDKYFGEWGKFPKCMLFKTVSAPLYLRALHIPHLFKNIAAGKSLRHCSVYISSRNILGILFSFILYFCDSVKGIS